MNQPLVRAAACTLAAAALTLALLAVPASSPSQAATFTFSDPNCSDFSYSNGVLSCIANPTSGAPTGCSLTASPLSVPSGGGTSNLAMTCTGGDPVTSCTWTAGTVTGTTACAAAVSVTAQTTFTAIANNATGPSSSKSVTVTVASGGGGGGGGGTTDTSACTFLGLTPHVITIPWGTTQQALTTNNGGFGANDAIVVKFTTSKGNISAVEYGNGGLNPRTGSLSASPCDFTGGLPANGGGITAFANDTAPLAYFSLVNKKLGAATLSVGTTYYFNIRNAGCSSASCDMQITLTKPAGS